MDQVFTLDSDCKHTDTQHPFAFYQLPFIGNGSFHPKLVNLKYLRTELNDSIIHSLYNTFAM